MSSEITSAWISTDLRRLRAVVRSATSHRMMKIRIVAITALCFLLAGCGYLPSVKHALSVDPVKYIPCWENMGPNTSCGSVSVPPGEAKEFVVIVGWKRYEDITESDADKKQSKQEKHKKFYNYASSEVVARGYCSAAHVPKDKRNVMRWEGSGDRGVYVVCTKG